MCLRHLFPAEYGLFVKFCDYPRTLSIPGWDVSVSCVFHAPGCHSIACISRDRCNAQNFLARLLALAPQGAAAAAFPPSRAAAREAAVSVR
jgi:hypothetical protein